MPPKTKRTQVQEDEKSIVESEVNSEIDPGAFEVNYRIQCNETPILSNLIKFFEDPNFINPAGDPSTNIVDRFSGKCYKIPPAKISHMFKLMEICRKAKIRFMFNEKQLEQSGIMLDFDVYQDNEEVQINTDHLRLLCRKIITLLCKMLNFNNEKKVNIVIGILRRPKITYNDEKSVWKDGLHLLIPGIKLTRPVKRLLIKRILDNEILDQVFSEVMPATMKIGGQSYQRKDFLDPNSAHVPVHFVGCPTKKGSPPYNLTHIFEVKVNTENNEIDDMVARNSLIDADEYNLIHEFSLNYEVTNNPLIKKTIYDLKDSLLAELGDVERKHKQHDEEMIRNYGELSTMAIHDVATREIKDLLDTLGPSRYEDFNQWFQVLCVLANTSLSYKALAEYFSRKSKKFNYSDFETRWNSITRGVRGKKDLQLGSLHYWAKQDNLDKYMQIRQQHVATTLQNMVYESYKEGTLSHADVAEIVYMALKHKYVTDTPDEERKSVWYEFVLDDDDHKDGEIYKWRASFKPPKSLSIFISRTLPKLFDHVLKSIKQNYDKSTGNTNKYLGRVLNNFKATMRSLGNTSFKKYVMVEAEDLFLKYGFIQSLDKDPLIRGVQNGILKLSISPGGRPKLIKGYHTHRVSKYTEVPYIPFNPYDELTRKIVKALRYLFPDNEPDSFEFTMSYLSSTIDGNPKESMFMIMRGGGGNGKTFLVELHKAAIGPTYGVKMPLSYLTSKTNNSDGPTPALMQLKEASLATYSESNRQEILNAARVKEMTGLETMAGRKMRENMINFKPKCHHLVTTNFDFVIECNDHGTWRRMVYNPLKITFIDTQRFKLDPRDPNQREADDTVTDKWTEDPEVRGRYLGYMVWVHYWLYRKYKGHVAHVPHPHIELETDKYRSRQDTIALFLSQRCVKTLNEESEVPLVDEIQKYMRWYNLNYSIHTTSSAVIDQFINSKLQRNIRNTTQGYMIIGYRFLDHNQQPEVGEELAFKNIFDAAVPADNFGIVPENADQYYARLCKEYDQYKHIFDLSETYDAVADVEGNEYVSIQNAPPKAIMQSQFNAQLKERENNLDDDDKPLFGPNADTYYNSIKNGATMVQLPEPSRCLFTDDYNCDGLLPDIGDIIERENYEIVDNEDD